jgi:hypothetical protein
MHRTQHRLLPILAAGTVALGLSAAPALAGSDGCSDDGDCQAENAPAAVVPAVPAPVVPAPLQATRSAEGGDTAPTRGDTAPTRGDTAPERASWRRNRHVTHQTRTFAVARRTVPRGAVAAGAGGTAPDDPDGVIFGVAGAALVMLAAGGRLVVAARRSDS